MEGDTIRAVYKTINVILLEIQNDMTDSGRVERLTKAIQNLTEILK